MDVTKQEPATLVDRFLEAWEGSSPPDVLSFLRAHAGELDVESQTEIVLQDQLRRTAPHLPIGVEHYLKACPAAAADPSRAVDLVYGEYRVGKLRGDAASPEDYLRRFPQWRAELRRQFSLNDWLNSAADVLETTIASHTLAPTDPTAPQAATEFEEAPLPYTDFQLGRRLGRGGMGDVFEADQRSLARKVAVKLIRERLADDAEIRSRFLREARIVAQLRHENIAAVYGIGRVPDGGYFLAMELVGGRSLDGLLEAGPLPVAEAVRIVCGVAEALAHAHKRGIVHRDLKPSNVLVEEGGRVVVVDFGLARSLATTEPALSTAAQLIGTPAFMAPEQVDTALGPVGPKTDLYGLGALFYTLLTGVAPHHGESIPQILREVLDKPPRAIGEFREDVPAAVARVCLKALAKKPSDRYDSADAFLADLSAAQAGAETSASSVSTTTSRHRRFNGAALVALLALFAAVTWGVFRSIENVGEPPPQVTWQIDVFREGKLERKEDFATKPGALSAGDSVRVGVRLTRPACVYLFWTDGHGNLLRLSPKANEAPQKRSEVMVPAGATAALPVEGPAAWEICVVVVREEPVAEDFDWQSALKFPTPPPLDANLAWIDGRKVDLPRAAPSAVAQKLGSPSRTVGEERSLSAGSAAAAFDLWRQSLSPALGHVRFIALPHR